ncbi:MAG: Holliday junction resolvase RuvX [Bacilli bacterium]|nr:Holliday junction resolvase RuvX [Bacilli bacterium]
MRYLGLDLGTKTLGVAISDKTNMLAYPYKTLRFSDSDFASILNELLSIIKDNNITEIALGLPKNMDSSLGFAAQRSKEFENILKEKTNVPITLIDERLTSVMAHNILHNNDKKAIKHKKIVDEVAACLILESFIKMKG